MLYNGLVSEPTYNLGHPKYSPSLCIINGKLKCYDWYTSSPRKSKDQGLSTYLGFGERISNNENGIQETGHFYIRNCNKSINMEFDMHDRKLRGSKINKLRRKAWANNDFDLWICMLFLKGTLTEEDVGSKNENFIKYSNDWNNKAGLKHDIGNIHGVGKTDPCCTNEEHCPCEEFNTMTKTDFGWECDLCGFKVGKHGYKI